MPEDRHIEAELIDRLYAVAMEPERYTELIEVWQDRLNQAIAKGGFAIQADIGHLESHIRRAETLLDLVDEGSARLPRPIVERMEAEPHPMFAIDAGGRVRAMNGAARHGFPVHEDEPASALPFDPETIAAVLGFGQGRHGGKSRLLRGFRKDTERPLLISLTEARTASGRSMTLMRLVDFTWPEALTPLVREAFDLTEAESEVLRLFAEGHNPTRIAELRKASVPTVRTQIRMIYDKTDTRNQAELIRMALGLGSLEFASEVSRDAKPENAPIRGKAPFPRPEDRRLLELPDGRIMEYSVFGGTGIEGGTCLFLHNEFYADIWPAQGVQRAIELGLRIIAPLRPYYGRSDAGEKGSIGPTQSAHDVAHLLDRLEIDRVIPMFQMAGGLTAAELARLFPERLAALVAVAPMYPFGNPEDENQLTTFHNYLSSIIHRHPRLLDFMARSGFAYYKRMGARRFLQTFAKASPPDLALLEDDATYPAMVRGLEFCARQGHRGFFNDYHHVPAKAEQSLLELDRPFVAVIGDGIPERRNRRLEELVQTHTHAYRIVAQDGGHYLHFSHPCLVAEAVVRAWRLATSV